MSEDDSKEMGAALAGARPADAAGLVLARARVESALFGTATGVARFHVLEQLGRGGMGVVYAAYDPELDRGVALKMIQVPDAGRELAVAEAKALAKLSHPNVVPVFDVGVVEDQVYIVMELVRGDTLRTWVKGKPARDIIDIYRQAGAALAAAHAAGLVHRDFKPDNAIVGSDGRVRVVDFGLACETTTAETGPRKVAGTPRYMAPEQQQGIVTPAIDQYSFCVALDEALRGEDKREPPRWVAALLDRGRAKEPEKRFASMAELLRALGRDPARLWKVRAGIGALAVAGVAAFFVGRARASDGPAPCSGGADEIAAAWPKAVRETQLSRIGELGAYGVEVSGQIRQRVDDHAARWVAGRKDACMAHRAGAISPALLDRRMICLDRSRAALGAVGELAASVDASGLAGLARAVTSVPDPAQCATLTALADEVEPPPLLLAPRVAVLRGELERARIQLAGGHANAARDIAHAAAKEMRTAGYQPLRAEALLVEGQASMRTDATESRAKLGEALDVALASHSDAIAVEAWARRAWVQGTQDDAAAASAALGGLDVIERLAIRTPSAQFARALLYNNVGGVEITLRHRAQARAAFETALREANGLTGGAALELGVARRNIVLVSDDVVAADPYLATAQTELTKLLGASHPDTLIAEFMRAGTTVIRLDQARAILEQTCERAALHESLAGMLPWCFAQLGDVRDELGDRAGAIAAYERAARAPESDRLEVAGTLAAWRGDLAGAARELEKAIAANPVPADAPLYAQHGFASLQLAYGRTLRALGKRDAARVVLERALVAMRTVDASVAVAGQRLLAQIEAELAFVSTGQHRVELATKALDWYRRAGAPQARLSELEAATR